MCIRDRAKTPQGHSKHKRWDGPWGSETQRTGKDRREMKNILVIDACVRREESRTKKLLDRALETLGEVHPDWSFEKLTLMELDLKYWNTQSLKDRDVLLAKKEYDHPVFAYGNQFRDCLLYTSSLGPYWRT